MSKLLITLASVAALFAASPSTAESPEPSRPVSEIALCSSATPAAVDYRPCVWPGTPSRICVGSSCIDVTPTRPFIVPETGAAYRTTRPMAKFLLGLGISQGAGRTLDCAVTAPHPCPYRK